MAEPSGRWSAAGSLAAGTRRRGSGLGPQLLAVQRSSRSDHSSYDVDLGAASRSLLSYLGPGLDAGSGQGQALGEG